MNLTMPVAHIQYYIFLCKMALLSPGRARL